MGIVLRDFDQTRDLDDAFRIWNEVGWAEKEKRKGWEVYISANKGLVGKVNGAAECLVLWSPGDIRHLETKLSFAGIMGVTTSRVARKLGLAQRLTARAVAQAAENGAAIVGLGMFEQGFYDQVGFGVGSYEHYCTIDPAMLRVSAKAGVPERLTVDNAAEMYQARLKRLPCHGMLNMLDERFVRSELMEPDKGFALGYRNEAGELTHYIVVDAKGGKHGPYNVWFSCYQSYDQLMELLALLRNMGDQVHTVTLMEPPGIQMQDLLSKPFRKPARDGTPRKGWAFAPAPSGRFASATCPLRWRQPTSKRRRYAST